MECELVSNPVDSLVCQMGSLELTEETSSPAPLSALFRFLSYYHGAPIHSLPHQFFYIPGYVFNGATYTWVQEWEQDETQRGIYIFAGHLSQEDVARLDLDYFHHLEEEPNHNDDGGYAGDAEGDAEDENAEPLWTYNPPIGYFWEIQGQYKYGSLDPGSLWWSHIHAYYDTLRRLPHFALTNPSASSFGVA